MNRDSEVTLLLVNATGALRDKILSGHFDVGKKLREVTVAEEFDVSRTIARLAMSTLEHEGLLVREPNRGSWIKLFSVDEIADAIEVRGELEAMAARKIAERGLDETTARCMQDILEDSERMLRVGVNTETARADWAALNVRYHRVILHASGNWPLRSAVEQISYLPLVSPSAMVFDRVDRDQNQKQLERAYFDHVEIFAAIQSGQGMRAADRMREHAFQNARNKRVNLKEPSALAVARSLPGGALIAQPA